MKIIGFMLLFMLFCSEAFASVIWYEKPFDISKMKYIVILNIEGNREFEEAEELLQSKVEDKFSKVYFTVLKPNKESGSVSSTDHIFKNFTNEKERSKAVCEYTGADAYIVGRVLENSVESFVSPRTESYVTIKKCSVDEEERSSDRKLGELALGMLFGDPELFVSDYDRTYDVVEEKVKHVIPEKQQFLRHFLVEFTVYNHTGRKMFVMKTAFHKMKSEQELFDYATDYLVRALKDAKKGKIR